MKKKKQESKLIVKTMCGIFHMNESKQLTAASFI